MRVIITRPQAEAAPWLKALDAAGYTSWSLPLIDIRPAAQVASVESVWKRLADFDAVMFVSRNAVHYFFEQKADPAPVFTAQAAIKTRAFVTGPGSYSALQRVGAEPAWLDAPDFHAGQFDSEALWAVVRSRVVHGYRVLIVRGTTIDEGASDEGSGRDWFARQVLDAGGEVEFVVSYERQRPQWDAPTIAQAQAAATDGTVWVFSSSEAIRNLQHCCPGVNWAQAQAVVTHSRIGDAARGAGFGRVRESKPLLPALMASIESLQ
ncbi:MAG: uroporphyrinogen-III synthase [Curvibacter sp.]|nr:MAG: uroporphyrinogen-III synthase [Curvibacter sp.]